jgi:hypothetical protein
MPNVARNSRRTRRHRYEVRREHVMWFAVIAAIFLALAPWWF